MRNPNPKRPFGIALATTALTLSLATQALAATELKIESWRNDDIDIWNEKIIPAFTAKHPDIKVIFAPMAPAEYNAALNAKLAGGTAGDLITCRPFDASLGLYKKGQLGNVNDVKGIDSFPAFARAAWSTDDGKDAFCVPIASVIHGFIYNKAIFDKLGLQPPKTQAEFKAVLDKIKADGTYTPMAMGTADQWEAATMGFQNVGANFWKGEEGRKALIAGTQKLTDAPYIAAFTDIAGWAPYLGEGFKAQKYPDSQNLFSLGRAAIYPAGSWDISTFKSQADFKMGAFPPPVPAAGDKCYISDHTDIAMGVNAKSPHQAEAKIFLEWLATPEFATLYSNALPGFYSLSSAEVTVSDPLAQEFLSWRKTCDSSIRNSYQILSRGTPNLENELWNVSAQVINGTMTPAQAGAQAQAGLAKWYAPQQK